MPRPLPPPYVKMPGRPKTQRKREPWEQPKGTKLSKVGIKMTCRLCGKSDHNARRCHLNPQAANKNMAHITREKTRKRKEAEAAGVGTSAGRNPRQKKNTTKKVTTSTNLSYCNESVIVHPFNSLVIGQAKTTASIPTGSQPIPTQASQAPRQATQAPRQAGGGSSSRAASFQAGRASSNQAARAYSSQPARASSFQAGAASSSQAASTVAGRRRSTARAPGSTNRLAHLMFGDNY
jgi:hypothetical protein